MQTAFAICKKNTDYYLTNSGYFELLDYSIKLFQKKEDAILYIEQYLPYDEYDIVDLYFIVGKRNENNIFSNKK